MKREHYSTTGVVFRTGISPRKSVGEGNAVEPHHMYFQYKTVSVQ